MHKTQDKFYLYQIALFKKKSAPWGLGPPDQIFFSMHNYVYQLKLNHMWCIKHRTKGIYIFIMIARVRDASNSQPISVRSLRSLSLPLSCLPQRQESRVLSHCTPQSPVSWSSVPLNSHKAGKARCSPQWQCSSLYVNHLKFILHWRRDSESVASLRGPSQYTCRLSLNGQQVPLFEQHPKPATVFHQIR